MTMSDTRAGIAQAKHNESAIWIVGFDALVAGGAAYVQLQNGLAAVGIGIGAVILLMVPVIGIIFGAAMSLLYGFAGYVIAAACGSGAGGAWAAGVIVGLVALGLHISAHQHARDLQKK